MTEREIDLRKTPERTSQQNLSVAERLVNTYLGRLHIEESIAALKNGDYSYDIERVVDVAQIIASVNISPAPALEVLKQLRDHKWDYRHEGKAVSWGMTKIQALLGDYEAVEKTVSKSLFPTDTYFFAARTQVARGEKPTKMLKAAEVITQAYNVKDPETSYVDQVKDYQNMGSIYAQAGLTDEAKHTFDIAEGIVDRARNQYNEAYTKARERGKEHWDAERAGLDASDLIGHDTSYDRLAWTYADIGWFEDALRVADKLKEDKSHYFSHVIDIIADRQLDRGLADDAVKTAKKLGGPTYVKTLARKAAIDAAQGKLYQETIQTVENIMEGKEYDEEYVKWRDEQAQLAVQGGNIFAAASHAALAQTRLSSEDYVVTRSTLGVATAKAGDLTATKAHFDRAWKVVHKEEDPLFKPSIIMDFGKAVDDAGFDASKIFGQAIDASESIPDEEDSYDIKWSTWVEAITESANRGYLDFARDGLSRYNKKDCLYDRSKARLLAHLGAAEIRNGLTDNEIQALAQTDIQTIFTSDNEFAKQAVLYFGLDKKLI